MMIYRLIVACIAAKCASSTSQFAHQAAQRQEDDYFEENAPSSRRQAIAASAKARKKQAGRKALIRSAKTQSAQDRERVNQEGNVPNGIQPVSSRRQAIADSAKVRKRQARRKSLMRSSKTHALADDLLQMQMLDLRAQSLALHRTLQQVADRMQPSPAVELLRALNLCAPCENLQRFGEEHDGGYVMCTDNLDHGVVAAYSYGVNGFDGWGMGIASRYHVPLHEYDCTDARHPTPCEGCEVYFHSECMTSPKDTSGRKNFRTFAEALATNGHEKVDEGSLLLKVDTEGAEWHAFAEESPDLFKMFRQIVVEYHWLHEPANHRLNLQAVRNIEKAGFAIAHLHGNNYEGMAEFENYSIPRVLEVTYVPAPADGCSRNLDYHQSDDRPNNKDKEELPDAILPPKV